MTVASETLDRALGHHRAGDLSRAEHLYRDLIRFDPASPAAYFHLGRILHQRGELPEAAQALQAALQRQCENAEIYTRLAIILTQLQERAAAVACFERVTELNPADVNAHINLAKALFGQSRYEESVVSCRRALTIDSEQVEAHSELAAALLSLNRAAEAVEHYRKAADLDPENAERHSHLGYAYRELGQSENAITCFRRSLRLVPDDAALLYALGRCFQEQDRLGDAENSFRQALELHPADAGVHFHLGCVCHQLKKLDEAIACFRLALKHDPDLAHAYQQLGEVLEYQEQLEEARACYEQVLARKPDDPSALLGLANILKAQDQIPAASDCYRRSMGKLEYDPLRELWLATLCPQVFEDVAQIATFRANLTAELDRIAEGGLKFSQADLTSRACPPPYELQFHGLDDRPIKEAYANLFADSFPADQPKSRCGRPKIGVVVSGGHERVFLRCMRGIVERIDTRSFDLQIICSQVGANIIRSSLKSESIGYHIITGEVVETANRVREAKFDVLLYWEVGSDIINYFLPFFHPAPVQAVAWGVPVTSGIDRMDYFLTSDLVEIDHAQEHYTEQLIRAPVLLTWQDRISPRIPTKRRADFGFADTENIYLCVQQIRKIHPDFDEMAAGVLRRDARGRVVIVADRRPYSARKLRDRMDRTIPDVADRVTFLPHQSFDEYLSLTSQADLFLDTPYFGAGITAFDAFAFGKAIVTLPSQFRRSRYATACYRAMGLEECIATSLDEYGEIAARLGTETDRRKSLESRILNGSAELFENQRAVTEYQRIFEQLLTQARAD